MSPPPALALAPAPALPPALPLALPLALWVAGLIALTGLFLWLGHALG